MTDQASVQMCRIFIDVPRSFLYASVLGMAKRLLENKDLLLDGQVCRVLQISVRTLQRWLRNDWIQPPAGMQGKNRRLWTRDELEEIRQLIARENELDTTSSVQPTRRRRKDYNGRYAGAMLRREGQANSGDRHGSAG